MQFSFKVLHKSKKSSARAGVIVTPHGEIKTPAFVAVGTNGVIKALSSDDLALINPPLIFCNTYHLMLQPGADIIEMAGGIHKFANINTPIITDSGGFQVFSLKYGSVFEEIKSKGNKKQSNSVLKINEEGCLFRSYRDGSEVFLSPETSIQAQKKIGADIIVVFDELLPYHIDPRYQKNALDRTHRWEERSLIEHKKNPKQQALYAVIHGGVSQQMRKQSIDFLSKLDFDGFGIGGSVGKDLPEMLEMLDFLVPQIPVDKPCHLLGIADLRSLEPSVKLGIDTFDSSYPTKAARHGLLLNNTGGVRILKSGNSTRFEPVSKDCECFTCKNYTIAYLCHLFKAHELTFYRLATIHNFNFMVRYMDELRNKIFSDDI